MCGASIPSPSIPGCWPSTSPGVGNLTRLATRCCTISPEAYVGDMVRPLKPAMPAFKSAERLIERAIFQRAGIDDREIPREVHDADKRIVCDEAHQLFRPETLARAEWSPRFGPQGVEPLGVTVVGQEPHEAERDFMIRLRSAVRRIENGTGVAVVNQDLVTIRPEPAGPHRPALSRPGPAASRGASHGRARSWPTSSASIPTRSMAGPSASAGSGRLGISRCGTKREPWGVGAKVRARLLEAIERAADGTPCPSNAELRPRARHVAAHHHAAARPPAPRRRDDASQSNGPATRLTLSDGRATGWTRLTRHRAPSLFHLALEEGERRSRPSISIKGWRRCWPTC